MTADKRAQNALDGFLAELGPSKGVEGGGSELANTPIRD
jgi:hypothetical protein